MTKVDDSFLGVSRMRAWCLRIAQNASVACIEPLNAHTSFDLTRKAGVTRVIGFCKELWNGDEILGFM